MKLIKENPFLAVWLFALTAICIYALLSVNANFSIKINLDGQGTEKVEVKKGLVGKPEIVRESTQ